MPRGFTLVELMVACAITATVLIATSQVLLQSQKALQMTAVEADLAAQAMSLADRIANDLKEAKASTVSPQSTNQNAISFQRCEGYGNSMLLGNTIQYSMYTDPARGLTLCRRTEAGSIADLTDALSEVGLNFSGSYGDPATAVPGQPYDVWTIQIQVERTTYSVVRKTSVKLRF
jgi:prepilin-type N-terminal cleavage/methylation domain-containing protein